MTPEHAHGATTHEPDTPTAPLPGAPRSPRRAVLAVVLVTTLAVIATVQSVRLTHTELHLAAAYQQVTHLRKMLQERTTEAERLEREVNLLRDQLQGLDALLRQRHRELNEARDALKHATTDSPEALPPEPTESIEPPERPTGISINTPPPHDTTPQPNQYTRDGED